MDEHFPELPGFQFHKELGRGGMAVVYLATQESLQRRVAIKVLHGSEIVSGLTSASRDRFVQEARTLASLSHPQIITIHDIARLPSGEDYISMEYLAGGDLTQHRFKLKTVGDVVEVILQIAEGLSVVHKQGIVHRDIKPANILFRPDGDAVLTDFGIAKLTEQDADLTQDGVSIGSPAYSSPEQAQSDVLDSRSDIYSLGVVFLDLLLGYNPFKGKSFADTALNHLQAPMPGLPQHLRCVETLLERMLAKTPENRYANCADVIRVLAPLVENQTPLIQNPLDLQSVSYADEPTCPTIKMDEPHDIGPYNQSAFNDVKKTSVRWSKWILGLGAIPLLYFLFFYQSEEERQINVLLEQAQARIEAEHYLHPKKDSALFYYEQVFAIDSDNRKAKNGIARATDLQVDAFLELGQQALEEGHLHKPRKRNAVHFYRQALKLDETNRQAKKGLDQVVAEYVGMAKTAFEHARYGEGLSLVDRGLKLDREHKTLLKLKATYKEKLDPVDKIFHRLFKS